MVTTAKAKAGCQPRRAPGAAGGKALESNEGVVNISIDGTYDLDHQVLPPDCVPTLKSLCMVTL
jgi:hypothetical protein